MSWSLVQSQMAFATSAVSSQAVTFSGSVTVGNLVVVGITSYCSGGATSYSVSDTHNTYHQDATKSSTGTYTDSTVDIWHSVVGTGGTLTVTVTPGSAAYVTVVVAEYSFSGTASVDATNSAVGNSNAPDSGSLTITATDLVVGMCDNQNNHAPTAGGSFTIEQNQNSSSGEPGFYLDQLNVTSNLDVTASLTGASGQLGQWSESRSRRLRPHHFLTTTHIPSYFRFGFGTACFSTSIEHFPSITGHPAP